jgi:RNA recognition motif-containing protein
VLLATAEDASRAVDMFNGYSWQTRILEVRPDRLPPDFDNPLGNVGAGAGFAVSDSQSNLNLNSTLSNISFGDPSCNSFPLPSTASSSMDDCDYNLRLGGSPDSPSSGRNLFIGNLPFHCQWQDLKDLFRQAGKVIRADVALGQDGRSRGFGSVVYATEVDADRAVQMFNGLVLLLSSRGNYN